MCFCSFSIWVWLSANAQCLFEQAMSKCLAVFLSWSLNMGKYFHSCSCCVHSHPVEQKPFSPPVWPAETVPNPHGLNHSHFVFCVNIKTVIYMQCTAVCMTAGKGREMRNLKTGHWKPIHAFIHLCMLTHFNWPTADHLLFHHPVFPTPLPHGGHVLLWSPAAARAVLWGSSVSEPWYTPTVYTGGGHMPVKAVHAHRDTHTVTRTLLS